MNITGGAGATLTGWRYRLPSSTSFPGCRAGAGRCSASGRTTPGSGRIAQALLSPILDVRGVAAAGDPAQLAALMSLLDPADDVPLAAGGAAALLEAVRATPGPCFVIAVGPLSAAASAVLMDPELMRRRAIVVWAGGAPYVGAPDPAKEDESAAEVVVGQDVELWQVTAAVSAPLARFREEVHDKLVTYGALGQYLAQHLAHDALSAVPAVGLVVNPTAAIWRRLSPSFRVADRLDEMWLVVDLVAKIAKHPTV